MLDQNQLLQKYADIIKEEVNVKEIGNFVSETPIVKVFKPIGSQLSTKFGKDTGQIISNGKQGNIRELGNGKIEVFSNQGGSWILDAEDYEIVYQGLDAENIAVEGNMIAKLSLEITPELEREGVARELSRFLNQMRKEADFAIDERVVLTYYTESEYLDEVVQDFSQFLQEEALLSKVQKGQDSGIITSVFSSNGGVLQVSLSR